MGGARGDSPPRYGTDRRRPRFPPIYKPLVSRQLGRVVSVKSPAFVNTPRYSEVSLAGARGFFLSLLERFSTLNLCLLAVFFVFVLRYLLVAIVTLSPFGNTRCFSFVK